MLPYQMISEANYQEWGFTSSFFFFFTFIYHPFLVLLLDLDFLALKRLYGRIGGKGCADRNPTGEGLIGVCASEIDEGVTFVACEDGCHNSFDGNVLSNMLRSFRVRDNRGIGARWRRKTIPLKEMLRRSGEGACS